MTRNNDTNPYTPPDVGEPTETLIRRLNSRKDAVVSAIVVGALFGVCIGFSGSYFAIPFIDADPDLQWVFTAIWLVSVITGLVTAIHAGRTKYRTAQGSSKQRLSSEIAGNQS